MDIKQILNIKDIAIELSLSHFKETEQKILIEKLEDRILEKVTIAIIEKLSESEREEFINIVNQEDPETIANYLNTKIPNWQIIVKEIAVERVAKFKSENQ